MNISQESFAMVDQFVDQILRVKDEEEGRVPIMLVANKLDLEDARVISSAGILSLSSPPPLSFLKVPNLD